MPTDDGYEKDMLIRHLSSAVNGEKRLPALEAVAEAAMEALGRVMEIKLLMFRQDNPDVWEEVCAMEVSLRAALAKLDGGK